MGDQSKVQEILREQNLFLFENFTGIPNLKVAGCQSKRKLFKPYSKSVKYKK